MLQKLKCICCTVLINDVIYSDDILGIEIVMIPIFKNTAASGNVRKKNHSQPRRGSKQGPHNVHKHSVVNHWNAEVSIKASEAVEQLAHMMPVIQCSDPGRDILIMTTFCVRIHNTKSWIRFQSLGCG